MKKILRLCALLILSTASAAFARQDISDFHNFPNPFSPVEESTTFVVKAGTNTSTFFKSVDLTVYNVDGEMMYSEEDISISSDTSASGGYILTKWKGVDMEGNFLVRGFYYVMIRVLTEDGDILRAYTKVVLN